MTVDTGKIFIIRDAGGERRLDESALPFGIGHGEGAQLRLSTGSDALDGGSGAHADETVIRAWIAFDRGHAFLQPDEAEIGLFHNRRHLSGSAWLKSGDIVQVGGALLRWRVDGDQVFIDIEPDDQALPTMRPPSEPPPLEPSPLATHRERGPAEPLPHVADAPVARPGNPWVRRGLALAGPVVLLIAAFVLLATPFEVDIQPAPDWRSVEGFPPPVRLGGRLMALPGEYRVHATKAGYAALDATIALRAGDFQRHRFQLRELPGWLTLTVNPAVPIRVVRGGEDLVPDAAGRYPLDPGAHTLEVHAERYLPATLRVEVPARDHEVAATISLKPAWAQVRLDTDPGGAEARLDGQSLGTTPLDVAVLQGAHTLELSRDGYKPKTLALNVVAGQDMAFGRLSLDPLDGTLILNSDPDAASVMLDGKYLGTTPLRTALKPDVTHVLRLTRGGRETRVVEVALASQETRELSVGLPAELGIVFLNAEPVDAELLIDGKPAGRATRRLDLPTRPHRLEVRKSGYLPARLEVTPRAGGAQRLNVVLKTPEAAQEEKRAAAKVARVTSADGQTLHLLEPTTPFRMGAPRREAGRRANESERLVSLSRPYFLADKEVSNARFRAFRASHDSGFAEGQTLNRPEQPVVNVSWDDAARYCNWLSAKDKLPPAYAESNGRMVPVSPMSTGYRLPSEAEWAYAARVAGRPQPARYAWGDGFPPPAAAGNWADRRIDDVFAVTVPDYDDGFRVSAPVGSFRANPAGFHDLGGNVAEWTNDWYAVYPGEATSLVDNPTGPPSGEHHVVRDTGWKHGSIGELRLAYRDYSREPRNDLGFRVARYVY